MKLSSIRVKNFRNLADIDVKLTSAPVIVGENGSGKSNLIQALRLVLDPSLSAQQRALTGEDFWEGLGADPMRDGAEISISVDLVGFVDEPGLLATLAGAIVAGDPGVARLTYLYRPRDGFEKSDPPIYEWLIYGGDDPDKVVGNELRSYIHLIHMQALRDSEADLASWRRSPLRPILDEIARSVPAEQIESVKAALEEARAAVNGLEAVQLAANAIAESSRALVGDLNGLDPTLELAPTDATRALRNLRLLLDGPAQRELSMSGLGTLNVLYLALLQAELARRLRNSEIEFALITIEEPEAHLHPHLQRRMFSGLQSRAVARSGIFVTTHSPHIVSVTNPKRLVRMRSTADGVEVNAALTANLSSRDWEDIGRYLDATRSEMAFAKRIILVEGFAEQVLLQRMSSDLDFDEEGLTICAIHGTHFAPYVKFVRGLGIPHAVITDGDPFLKNQQTGAARVAALCGKLGCDPEDAEAQGLFTGVHTLEVDVYNQSQTNARSMVNALKTMFKKDKAQTIEDDYTQGKIDGMGFLKLIGQRKGLFAQRLATQKDPLAAPEYINKAFGHVRK